jgi:hypothetical protein
VLCSLARAAGRPWAALPCLPAGPAALRAGLRGAAAVMAAPHLLLLVVMVIVEERLAQVVLVLPKVYHQMVA